MKSIKLLALLNTLGVLVWIPVFFISIFFWEDALNPLIFLSLVVLYSGTLLTVFAFLISIKNFFKTLEDISPTSKKLLWVGSITSALSLLVLFHIGSEVAGWDMLF